MDAVALEPEKAHEQGQVPPSARRALERYSGFAWKKLVQWYKLREQYTAQVSRLKMGLHGPRPFGSNQRRSQLESTTAQGRRLRLKPLETYQSAVLQQLRSWFHAERSRGHDVSSHSLRNFYIKFLERQAVR